MFSFLYRKNKMNEQMRNYLKHSTNESVKRILETLKNKNSNAKLDLTENTYTINKNNYKSSNIAWFLSLTSLLYYFYSNQK